jgi:hypothetical protein
MPSKLSGGKRAAIKKRKERAAARKRSAGGDWCEKWIADVKKIGAPPKSAESAHGWLGRAALLIVQATMQDTALPPEQMRRDAMKQIEQASKVMDPAKLSEQLAELEDAMEKLERKHAGDVEAGTDRPTPSEATLS